MCGLPHRQSPNAPTKLRQPSIHGAVSKGGQDQAQHQHGGVLRKHHGPAGRQGGIQPAIGAGHAVAQRGAGATYQLLHKPAVDKVVKVGFVWLAGVVALTLAPP